MFNYLSDCDSQCKIRHEQVVAKTQQRNKTTGFLCKKRVQQKGVEQNMCSNGLATRSLTP